MQRGRAYRGGPHAAKTKKAREPKRAERYPPASISWDWLSRKEHRGDALALRAEERRDKLRKAAGRSRYP